MYYLTINYYPNLTPLYYDVFPSMCVHVGFFSLLVILDFMDVVLPLGIFLKWVPFFMQVPMVPGWVATGLG